jgi:hypothetical protein
VADVGYIKTVIRQIPDETTRRALDTLLTYILGNIRIGVPEHKGRAVNLQAYFQTSTSATTSTGEFSIAHGLGAVPHLAIPVLDLQQPGARLVPLEVSRAADAQRLYLKSTSTSAAFWLLVE